MLDGWQMLDYTFIAKTPSFALNLHFCIMRTFFHALVTILVIPALFFLSGCNKNRPVEEEFPVIVGATDYVNSLAQTLPTFTKAGEITDEDAYALIAPMFPSAISFLEENGYDYSEDFEDGDPLIIGTALALAEAYYIYNQPQTRSFLEHVEAVAACIFIGADGGILAGMGTKWLCKKIAKKLAETALESIAGGVGVAIGVADAAICIYNHYAD